MQTDELKPCPFCGGAPHLMHCGVATYMIQCLQCKATTDDGCLDRISANWNRRALTAALSDEQTRAGVKVKALDWDFTSAYPMRAKTIIGDYTVWADAPRFYVDGPNGFSANKGSVEAAKAAAQTDYEQRIRSALSPRTVSTSEKQGEGSAIGYMIADATAARGGRDA